MLFPLGQTFWRTHPPAGDASQTTTVTVCPWVLVDDAPCAPEKAWPGTQVMLVWKFDDPPLVVVSHEPAVAAFGDDTITNHPTMHRSKVTQFLT